MTAFEWILVLLVAIAISVPVMLPDLIVYFFFRENAGTPRWVVGIALLGLTSALYDACLLAIAR